MPMKSSKKGREFKKFGLAEPAKKKRSGKQEKRYARILDGYTNPGSGCFDLKNDVTSKKLGILVENKTTAAASYYLKSVELVDLCLNAATRGLRPVFGITFEVVRIDVPKDWVCIPLSDYEELKRKEL